MAKHRIDTVRHHETCPSCGRKLVNLYIGESTGSATPEWKCKACWDKEKEKSMPYTIEQVDEAWNNFKKFTETAEQHDFPALAAMQLKFEPLYNDLHENWDEHHAEIFMKWMQKLGAHFGFKVPDISEGE